MTQHTPYEIHLGVCREKEQASKHRLTISLNRAGWLFSFFSAATGAKHFRLVWPYHAVQSSSQSLAGCAGWLPGQGRREEMISLAGLEVEITHRKKGLLEV